MGVSKVEFSGNTLIDLTNDSVTEDKMLSGVTAHNAKGELVIGNIPVTSALIIDNPEVWGSGNNLCASNIGNFPMAQYMEVGTGIDMYIPLSKFGDATAEEVPKGATFTSAEGLCIEGTGKSYDEAFDEGYNEGYNEGYDDGNSDGYDAGYYEGQQDALAPLVIQKTAQAGWVVNGVTYYAIDDYETDYYGYNDFLYYEVSVDSATETITIVNNTNLTMKVAISDRCEYYDGASWYDEEYTTFFTVAPKSSNSGSMTAGQGSQYDWYRLSIYVRFDV